MWALMKQILPITTGQNKRLWSFLLLSWFVFNSCTEPTPIGFSKAELRKTEDSTRLQFNAVLHLKKGNGSLSIETSQLKVYFDNKYLGTAFLVADTENIKEEIIDLPFRIVFNAEGFVLKKPEKIRIQGEMFYNGGKTVPINYSSSVNILNLTLR
jgi:hypothetical protein